VLPSGRTVAPGMPSAAIDGAAGVPNASNAAAATNSPFMLLLLFP
jgi:hypothetical protein